MWKDALKKRKGMTPEELANAKERMTLGRTKGRIDRNNPSLTALELSRREQGNAKARRRRERYMKLSPEEKAKHDASLKEAQDRARRNIGLIQDADGNWHEKKDKK